MPPDEGVSVENAISYVGMAPRDAETDADYASRRRIY